MNKINYITMNESILLDYYTTSPDCFTNKDVINVDSDSQKPQAGWYHTRSGHFLSDGA